MRRAVFAATVAACALVPMGLSVSRPAPCRGQDATAKPSDAAAALDDAVDAIVSIQTKDRFYRFVKLAALTKNAKTGEVRSLSIEPVDEPDAPKPRTAKKPRKPGKQSLPLASIEQIWRDGEAIYTSPKFAATAAEEERFDERAKANDVRVWRRESWDEHQASLKSQRERLEKFAAEIPGTTFVENDEYMILAQLPANEVEVVARGLAAMHESLCKLFGYRPGTPIWKGKAMIVIFKTQKDYQAFETKLFGDSPAFAEAVCTYVGDKDAEVLVLGCHAGKDAESFSYLYCHETSHGFVWRYRSAKHPPSWMKEGMAEVIAEAASGSRELAIREKQALGQLRTSRSLGGALSARSVDYESYAVLSQLIKFMMNKDNAAFLRFLDGIKEGLPWEESLKQNWNATPEELVSAFGRSIGIPDLRP